MFNKKILIFVIIFQILSSNISTANVKIVAFVDNEIITNVDVKKESEYLKLLNSQLENLNKKKILELSKTSLINEIIKKKEISKFTDLNSEKNQFTNERLKNIVLMLDYKNEDEYMNALKKRNSYSMQEIKKKIDIELFWNELIFKKFNKLLIVNEEKLKNEINKSKNKKKKKILLSEIVFKLDKNEKYDDKINKLNSSILEIGFQNTANIFSISESSKYGGKLGWIDESSLSPKILEHIDTLNKGEISKEIKIGNNYLILKIEDIEIKKFVLDENEELKKLIQIEKNNQLNRFSQIYFNKLKMNYSINEK